MREETLSDILAEMRHGVNQSLHDLADRIELAAKREREAALEDANDDTTLVMNCETCANYDKNRQYCPVHDLMVARCCARRLPVLDTGPCGRWKCRIAKKR